MNTPLSQEISKIRNHKLIDMEFLVRLLMANGDRVPKAEIIASELCLSPRTFNRYLKRSGFNYRKLREQVQKNKASYYLLETDNSIKEISRSLGYANPSNFTKAFKVWWGELPREYRKSRRR